MPTSFKASTTAGLIESAGAEPAITIGRIFTTSMTGIAPESVLAFIIAQLLGAGIGLTLARNVTDSVHEE